MGGGGRGEGRHNVIKKKKRKILQTKKAWLNYFKGVAYPVLITMI